MPESKPRWRKNLESWLWFYLGFVLPMGIVGGLVFYVAAHITIGWK